MSGRPSGKGYENPPAFRHRNKGNLAIIRRHAGLADLAAGITHGFTDSVVRLVVRAYLLSDRI